MATQRCTQCGSKLNIAKLEPGSKFACFNCGTILVAGAKPQAVKKSLSEGPAFQPKAQKQQKPDPSIPTRSRRPRADGMPVAEKSKAPLLIGAGLVVVAGIILAVVMGGGDGGGLPGMGGGGGGGGGGTASKVTAADWWAETEPALLTATADELRGFLSRARSRGYDKDPSFASMADSLFDALISKDPDDASANRHLGRKALQEYPGFRSLWSSMNDNFKLIDKRTKAFLRKHEDVVESGRKVWLDTEGYDAASATLAAYAAWTKRLASDPSILQIEKGRTRARGEFDKFDAGVAVARPFILFVGFRMPPGVDSDTLRPARDDTAKQYKPVLDVVTAEFEKRFRAPLELPAMDGTTPLYFWLFENKGEFDAYASDAKLFGARVDITGGFNVKSRWAFAGITDPRVTGRNVAHVAATQLQWFFSKDPKKTYMNYFEEWNGLWFTVGFASWLGGVELDAVTGSAKWTGMDPRHAAHLKAIRGAGIPWVSLRELTQLESRAGFTRWISDTWWPALQGDDDIPKGAADFVRPQLSAFATRLLYAQAWGLAHFLNEKHPQQYQDLLMTALRGRRKPQKYKTDRLKRWRNTYTAFAEIMGLKSDADWDSLSKQYETHLESLAR